MRSHIAVAFGAVLGLTISFQALAQNANQPAANAASSNANASGPANSNSRGTHVDMGIVRQTLLGVIPAVAPYQEYSPGPHITSPDPASLTMATLGALTNTMGQAMLPPDAAPWQRAVVAGISGVLSSAREGVGPAIITGIYGAATSAAGSAADFVTAPPDWESFNRSHLTPPNVALGLAKPKNSPAYENAQIAINAGLAGLGTAGVTGVAAWLTDMAIVPVVVEGTAIVANAPVLIPTLVIAGGIAFIGTVIDKKLDLPPFLYTDPQGVPGNTASNTNQNFGETPSQNNTGANTNRSDPPVALNDPASPPPPNLVPNPVPAGNQPPPPSAEPGNTASNTNQDAEEPPGNNAGANANDSDVAGGSNDSDLPLPPSSPEPGPVGKQAGLPKQPPRYGDPGEGGMGPPPPQEGAAPNAPTPPPLGPFEGSLPGGPPPSTLWPPPPQDGPPPETAPLGPLQGGLPGAPPAQPPGVTPAQPQQPPVTPAAGQQGATPPPTEVWTLCYKRTYLEGSPLMCTDSEFSGPYCADGSRVSNWSSASSKEEQCKDKGGVWISTSQQQLCTEPPPGKDLSPEFCQPAECRPPGANERSWDCKPLQPAGQQTATAPAPSAPNAAPMGLKSAVLPPKLLPPIELQSSEETAHGAPTLLPPVVLAPTLEASTMPKPPDESSSMPKPPAESSKPSGASKHGAKPPKARGRRTAKRYTPRRVPAQRYDPAATAAAIGAIIGAINAANAGKRSRGGGGGGGGHGH
jgi:hypothetical protein